MAKMIHEHAVKTSKELEELMASGPSYGGEANKSSGRAKLSVFVVWFQIRIDTFLPQNAMAERSILIEQDPSSSPRICVVQSSKKVARLVILL